MMIEQPDRVLLKERVSGVFLQNYAESGVESYWSRRTDDAVV
jgi:hypothetical protein